MPAENITIITLLFIIPIVFTLCFMQSIICEKVKNLLAGLLLPLCYCPIGLAIALIINHVTEADGVENFIIWQVPTLICLVIFLVFILFFRKANKTEEEK